MAQKILVTLVDDLDGTNSDDVSAVQFGLDGVTYDIDLSDCNAQRLRDALAEFVDAARSTGGRKRAAKPGQGGTRSGTSAKGEARLIREWALENGYELSGRGRIPKQVIEQYRKATKGRTRAGNTPNGPASGAPTSNGRKTNTKPAPRKRKTAASRAT